MVVLLFTECDHFSSGGEQLTIGASAPVAAKSPIAPAPTVDLASTFGALVTPASYLPGAVGTARIPLLPSVSMSQAWGEQIQSHIKQISLLHGDNYFYIPQSATQDGKFILATLNPPDAGEDNPDRHASVVMIDVATGQPTTIGQTANSAIEPYDVFSDENWIVWTQLQPAPGCLSGEVAYAYNRNDYSTREIVRTTGNKDGVTVLGSDGSARIDHGILVWVEYVPNTGGTYLNLVKLMNMQTGQITTLSQNGYAPSISWPHIAWIEIDNSALGSLAPAPEQVKSTVTLFNLEDGTRKTLTRPDKPSYIALYKDVFVWISADHKRVLLTDLDETFEQTVGVAVDGDSFQEPVINNRLITWNNQGSFETKVWDRKQNRLISVAPKGASHIFVGPRNLLWVAPPPNLPASASEINILDTTLLP